MSIKVAVCQVPEIREDVEAALWWIEKFAGEAEEIGASLVCFPECFLQGYLTEKSLAGKFAINLNSVEFKKILKRLSGYNPVIVFGMIETDEENLFNTAVVIKHGEIMGKYRKIHLLGGEGIFKNGNEYLVYEIGDLKFSINICYDTQFPASVAELGRQGAKLILCPSNNMMRYKTAEQYKHIHHQMRIERVKENKIWLLSADVTGERDGRISYGPTSAINPDGEIIAQIPLMETGMLTVEI